MYEEVLLNLDFIQLAQFLTRLPTDVPCDDLFRCIATISMEIDKRQFAQVLQQHRDVLVTWHTIWRAVSYLCVPSCLAGKRFGFNCATVVVTSCLVFGSLLEWFESDIPDARACQVPCCGYPSSTIITSASTNAWCCRTFMTFPSIQRLFWNNPSNTCRILKMWIVSKFKPSEDIAMFLQALCAELFILKIFMLYASVLS